MEDFNRLDVAAKLFPSVTTKNNSSVFRLSVVMKQEVDARALQLAVNMIYERFSLFFLRLKRGMFWNYFDKNFIHFDIEPEDSSPCTNMLTLENKGYIVKVLYYKNRISVEAFHSLTDASGVVEFLKSLVYYYISIKYETVDSEGKIYLFDEEQRNDEDSFLKHFSSLKKQKGLKQPGADNSFRIRGKRYKKRGHGVISAVIGLPELLKYCKDNDCTVTAFLTANMIFSIYEQKQKQTKSKRPIVVSVPVNLRKIYDSNTLKNFFGVVNIGYSVSEDTTFDEVLHSVSIELKTATEQDNLRTASEKNVKMSLNIFSRAIPLIFKNIVIPIGFNYMGESKKTITISNIGRIDFPQGVNSYIEHTEMLLYPTVKSPINCGICSFEDKMTVNFTKTITDTEVIKHFITSLAEKTGADVSVYSNMWGR